MTVVGLSLGFSGLLLGAIFIEWFVFDPFLEFFTLFFGVFIGFYSVRDIYDGTLLTETYLCVTLPLTSLIQIWSYALPKEVMRLPVPRKCLVVVLDVSGPSSG